MSHLHNTNAAFALRCTDWERLKGELRRAGIPGFEFLSIPYPTFFGFAGSSGLSIIPILATKDLPAWVAPAYMIVTIAAFLLGIVFAWLDRKIKAVVREDLQNNVTGMEKFESQAGTPIKEK